MEAVLWLIKFVHFCLTHPVFSENSLSKKFKMGSISIPSKSIPRPLGDICHNGAVFFLNVSLTSFGGITSNFVFGVFNGNCSQIWYHIYFQR